MYIDLPILFIVVFFCVCVCVCVCLNLLLCMSVQSLIICIILFYVLFNFCKYLFYCIRSTVCGDYISNLVYYRSNSSLEIKRSLQYYQILSREPNRELNVQHLITTPATRSFLATIPLMPVMNRISKPPTASYLSLSDAFPNTRF